MTWPETLELELTGIAQGGAAVGRWEGRAVFAYGGLPGERVRVRLEQRQRDFASGRVTDIYTPSVQRVPPPDPTATHADWQHIAYSEQLRLKRQIVIEQLAHLGRLSELEVAPTLPAPEPWGYRNSGNFHGDAAGRLGYYAPGTRTVLDRNHDPLLLPVLNQALQALRDTLTESKIRLQEVTLRASATRGTVLGILNGTGDLAGLAKRWQAVCPALTGSVALQRGLVKQLFGEQFLVEAIGGLSLQVSATSFFQVNTAQATTLLRLASEWLRPTAGMRLLDAYCGVGTFALPLAATGAAVTGIEEHARAIDDAEASAAQHGLRIALLHGRVEALLPTLEVYYDGALLDPPRRGCAPEALADLASLNPARIAYISCHPGTLARDLRVLADAGYHTHAVQPVDMFPQTHHIEAIALLERSE